MSVNHKELSEQIARVYSEVRSVIETAKKFVDNGHYAWIYEKKYITKDIGEMMRLAIENGIDVEQHKYSANQYSIALPRYKEGQRISEAGLCYYTDYNNDQVEATCIAIARVLIKLKGE